MYPYIVGAFVNNWLDYILLVIDLASFGYLVVVIAQAGFTYVSADIISYVFFK